MTELGSVVIEGHFPASSFIEKSMTQDIKFCQHLCCMQTKTDTFLSSVTPKKIIEHDISARQYFITRHMMLWWQLVTSVQVRLLMHNFLNVDWIKWYWPIRNSLQILGFMLWTKLNNNITSSNILSDGVPNSKGIYAKNVKLNYRI